MSEWVLLVNSLTCPWMLTTESIELSMWNPPCCMGRAARLETEQRVQSLDNGSNLYNNKRLST